MLFAGSKPEVQSIIGLQEQNKICLQSNPPKCFDLNDPFDTSIKTGSPRQTPSRKDFEDEMRPGAGGPPADFDIKDFLTPVKKAEVAWNWNEGGGIEKEGFDSVPDYLKNKLREMEWKKDLQESSELENPGLVQNLIEKAEGAETWNEGTGIEKGGYENAPQWLRDQLWKQDLRKRQELGLEPVAS